MYFFFFLFQSINQSIILVALPLKLQPLLGRLVAVVAPALLLLLLVAAQAGAELDVDARRGREAEALGDLDEVELVHVEDGAEGVGGVGLEVRAVAFFGGLDGGYSQDRGLWRL